MDIENIRPAFLFLFVFLCSANFPVTFHVQCSPAMSHCMSLYVDRLSPPYTAGSDALPALPLEEAAEDMDQEMTEEEWTRRVEELNKLQVSVKGGGAFLRHQVWADEGAAIVRSMRFPVRP